MHGLTLMVGHTFEYNAAVWKLKELINSGELGRILYVDTARLSLGRYQNDCNVIWDLAPHDISIVSYLLDEFPEVVAAWAQRNVGDIHADVAYLRFDFPSSAVPAFVHVSWLDPYKVRRVTVVGERKMVVYNDVSDSERIRIYDVGVAPAQPAPYEMPVTYRTGDITSPYVQFAEPLLVQDSHFIDCIRTGAGPTLPASVDWRWCGCWPRPIRPSRPPPPYGFRASAATVSGGNRRGGCLVIDRALRCPSSTSTRSTARFSPTTSWHGSRCSTTVSS